MRRQIGMILIGALLLGGSGAYAFEDIKKKEEGWFFYKDKKVVKKEKPKQEPKKVEKTVVEKKEEPKPEKKKEDPFSTNWVEINLPKLMRKAIDTQDDKDIKAYLYANRVLIDKATVFSEKAMEQVRMDAFLDETNRFPSANFATNFMSAVEEKARDDAIKIMIQRGGLWFFFDSTCNFCLIQYEALKGLKEQYPEIIIKNVSLDGKPLQGMNDWVRDTGQFKNLKLELNPAVVYAMPPKKIMVISQGATSTDGIKERMIMHGRKADMFSKKLVSEIFMFERGILKSGDFNDIGDDVDMNDPEVMVDFLRSRVRRSFQND